MAGHEAGLPIQSGAGRRRAQEGCHGHVLLPVPTSRERRSSRGAAAGLLHPSLPRESPDRIGLRSYKKEGSSTVSSIRLCAWTCISFKSGTTWTRKHHDASSSLEEEEHSANRSISPRRAEVLDWIGSLFRSEPHHNASYIAAMDELRRWGEQGGC